MMNSDANWQRMIDSHGQENWDVIYSITNEHVSISVEFSNISVNGLQRENRFYPEQQEKIRTEVMRRLGG